MEDIAKFWPERINQYWCALRLFKLECSELIMKGGGSAVELAEHFQMDASFLAWARGVARNKILEHFRKCGKLPHLFDEELLELMAASAGQQDDLRELRRAALAECIRQLAPRARQILEWRYAEEPASPPEIARRLAWTVAAVHVALTRARKFLQDCTRRRLAASEG